MLYKKKVKQATWWIDYEKDNENKIRDQNNKFFILLLLFGDKFWLKQTKYIRKTVLQV